VGDRQLRRLFQEHLGASPLAVAQTRRILLAKHLIHETRLPMIEVALAAGFGSTRRFNDTFRRLFRRPPGALRRRGSVRGEGSPIELRLTYKPPYDWDAIIGFLSARAIAGIETVTPALYRRSFAGGTVAVAHAPARQRLRLAIDLDEIGTLPDVLRRVRRVFDLDADPEIIAAHLANDPHLAPLVAGHPGLRVPGGWDGFEMAVRAIVGQQITIAGARNLLGKLVAAYGARRAAASGGLTHVFPTPERLAEADIASLGMPAARGRAIANLARAALADPSLFERGASLDDAIAKLCAVPGVGPWTAHYIAIRALREPDAFPESDIGLIRALAEAGVRPSPKQVLARAEAWRPWRGYAAQHLWTHDIAPTATKDSKHDSGARTIAVADRDYPARL
jgi:AraC family transcriptional regulator of adaptative response / DNA-3-methyladenine glycosylase II